MQMKNGKVVEVLNNLLVQASEHGSGGNKDGVSDAMSIAKEYFGLSNYEIGFDKYNYPVFAKQTEGINVGLTQEEKIFIAECFALAAREGFYTFISTSYDYYEFGKSLLVKLGFDSAEANDYMNGLV